MQAFAWSFVSVAILSLGLNTACGSKDEDDEAATVAASSTYTYAADTKSIIDANCATAGCHAAGSANGPLTSLAQVKTLGTSKMITRIGADDSTRMPPSNTTFETSAEGKKLLDWLAGGADLK